MATDRIKRVNELLKREIGTAIFSLLNGAPVDVAAITVTYVSTSRNLRTAQVGISIRDHKGEEGSILSLLSKYRRDIQDRINKNLVLKYTPKISFRLDQSVEKGDNVLHLLADLEEDSLPDAEEPPTED